MTSYVAYYDTQVVHNYAHEVAKYLMADMQVGND